MTIFRLHTASRVPACLSLLTASLVLIAGTAAADVAEPAKKVHTPARVVILGEDDQHVTLSFDANRLQIVGVDGDEVEVTTIDLDDLGRIIDDAVSTAMSGLETALEALITCSFDHEVDRARVVKRGMRSERADLEAEIADLKAEIAELRADLDRLR